MSLVTAPQILYIFSKHCTIKNTQNETLVVSSWEIDTKETVMDGITDGITMDRWTIKNFYPLDLLLDLAGFTQHYGIIVVKLRGGFAHSVMCMEVGRTPKTNTLHIKACD